jgi:hypothetical protein
LAVVERIVSRLRTGVESVNDYVRNTLTYRVLLLIFWLLAFLLPWLLLVSSYTLKVYEDLTGKEIRFGENEKDTP